MSAPKFPSSQAVLPITAPQKGLRPTPILKLTRTNGGTKNSPLYGCLFSSGALPFVTDYYEQKIRASQTGGKTAIAATIVKAVSGSQTARDQLMPATELSLKLETANGVKTKTGAHLGTVVTTLPSLMMRLDPFQLTGLGTGLRAFKPASSPIIMTGRLYSTANGLT